MGFTFFAQRDRFQADQIYKKEPKAVLNESQSSFKDFQNSQHVS